MNAHMYMKNYRLRTNEEICGMADEFVVISKHHESTSMWCGKQMARVIILKVNAGSVFNAPKKLNMKSIYKHFF